MAAKLKKDGLRRGDVVKGRYEILRLIGEGGMSRVFLAADLQLTNKQWAVKEVDRRAVDPVGRPIEQSLASEAELLSKLDHPNIVDIVDIDKTDDYIYVVMDHVEGQSLDKVVREHGPQSEENVQRWMLQICDAVGYLHRQDPPVIYRDMKPNNIMLHPDGYVKLIDFGVSREYKDEAKKDTIAFGTTGYAAPEQYGKAQTDARTDIYGLGATMWHLLGGEAPPVEFPLPNVGSVNENVGEGFADVIIPKCTELEREKRYQSCDELAVDLEMYHELTREYRAKQTNKVVAFATTGILAVLLVFVGIGMLALRSGLITENYEYHMSIANSKFRTEPEVAAIEYASAIGYKPDAVDAYEGLIKCYEVDGKFEAEEKELMQEDGKVASEKEQFDSLYQGNIASLQNSSRFAELSYEIGRLYWYYYSYGQTGSYEENQATRIKASTEYFGNAMSDPSFEKSSTAETYYSIAQFTTDVDNLIRTGGEDKELYVDYWNSMVDLVNRIDSEPLEIVKLDSCILAADALETYTSKFKSIGEISEQDVMALRDEVATQLETMKCTGENEVLREQTLNRVNTSVVTKIATVYSQATIPEIE